MADTVLPDKWVRKAIYDAFNGTVVSSNTVNVYDYSVPEKTYPPHHILMLNQVNEPIETHCGRGWLHTIQLDITTTFPQNTGSRVLADEIAEALLPFLDNLELDVASNLLIARKSISFPGDLRETDDKFSYFRKIINLELEIR